MQQSQRLESLGQLAGGVAQVRRAGERATELTRQLLTFGRREVVRPQALSRNAVLDGVEPLLRRSIGAHNDLRITPGTGLWPTMADPGQLEQILVNLAVNARDAMSGGGTLLIDTENLTVDEDYAVVRP